MGRFAALKADIQRELKNLGRLARSMGDLLKRIPPEGPTEIEIRAAGSLVHDFYTGLEKTFQRIALKIDGDLPAGGDWHLQLLQRMATPLEEVRPAVLSEQLAGDLEEYLRFRHLFRNIYGFELKWEKLQPLAQGLEELFQQLEVQLREFEKFLDSLE